MFPTSLPRQALRRAFAVALGAMLLGGMTTAAHAAPPAPDATQLPFAATSPWRLGVATTATFAPAGDSRNVQISDVAAHGSVWINHGTYSHPITQARPTDPLATVSGAKNPGGPWQERIPANARIADGYDKHMHVITPDRQSVQEHYAVVRLSETSYTAKRRHEVSLSGPGIGPQNGTRAYGGSAIGGLIRAWEVDPTHPSYTGRIDHALAMALPRTKLKYTGTAPHQGNGPYDLKGFGLDRGYVWPATEQDTNSSYTYSGSVPMGSYFAIPSTVDVTTLGLRSPQALMIARALQDYGAYVTDASSASVFYVEDDGGAATKTFRNAAVGPTSTGDDLRRIFRSLRVVTSNSEATPNGGPVGVARRGAAAALSTQTASVPTQTASAPFAAKVRFQDGSSVPPTGYVADWGQPFGARGGPTQGSGLSYGWVLAGTTTPVDLARNGRVRIGTTTTDPRLTGLVHMDWQSTAGTGGTATPGSWELAVPNGSYAVTVSVGDAGNYYNSTHQIDIEGVSAVSRFVGTATTRFAAATRTVTVSDGRLTLSHVGGTNTKINYVDVVRVSTGA